MTVVGVGLGVRVGVAVAVGVAVGEVQISSKVGRWRDAPELVVPLAPCPSLQSTVLHLLTAGPHMRELPCITDPVVVSPELATNTLTLAKAVLLRISASMPADATYGSPQSEAIVHDGRHSRALEQLLAGDLCLRKGNAFGIDPAIAVTTTNAARLPPLCALTDAESSPISIVSMTRVKTRRKMLATILEVNPFSGRRGVPAHSAHSRPARPTPCRAAAPTTAPAHRSANPPSWPQSR